MSTGTSPDGDLVVPLEVLQFDAANTPGCRVEGFAVEGGISLISVGDEVKGS